VPIPRFNQREQGHSTTLAAAAVCDQLLAGGPCVDGKEQAKALKWNKVYCKNLGAYREFVQSEPDMFCFIACPSGQYAVLPKKGLDDAWGEALNSWFTQLRKGASGKDAKKWKHVHRNSLQQFKSLKAVKDESHSQGASNDIPGGPFIKLHSVESGEEFRNDQKKESAIVDLSEVLCEENSDDPFYEDTQARPRKDSYNSCT